MNSNEAKFILQARRPDGSDDAEPRFSEALEQARRDPALTEWLAREQGFDTAVATKLRAVQPPADLRAAILAGARASRPVAFWLRPQVLAMAASVAIVCGLALAWPAMRSAATVDQLAMGVMTEVDSDAHHDAMPMARGALHAVLSDANTRLAAGFPLNFDQLKADGCRSVKIGGREVLEVCFERGGSGFHIYVAKRGDFKGEGEPMFRERGTLASVAWTDANHAYVLVSADGAAAVRGVF
ncbi:MAG: hypothetical protein H7Y06_08985 [Opitutaceae bacterium]|nr:hypothetical protein [Opitutaceae bacterium]